MAKCVLGCVAAAALGSALSAASAATISADFMFSGSIRVGSLPTEVLGPNYPDNNPLGGTVRRETGRGPNSFATVSASGFDDPVQGTTFANGVNAFGTSEAVSDNKVVVTISNNEAFAETFIWNGTIFRGGTGLVIPSADCNRSAIDECASYNEPFLPFSASAETIFGATLDGNPLFDGRLFVNETGSVQSFSGITLENLRKADDGAGNVVNDFYFWWDETQFTIDLGILRPGETAILEFFVMTRAISDNSCSLDNFGFNCVGAQAGFGDPDDDGGAQLSTGFTFRGRSYTGAAGFPSAIETAPVPVPAGVWLFGTAFAGVLGARRLQRA